MENILRSKEYRQLVETGYSRLAVRATTNGRQVTYDAAKFKDIKIKNYLFQAIDRKILETILVKYTTKQIWYSMKKFEGSARVKRSHLQALRREFETLEMKDEGVNKYFARGLSVASKMRTYG